MVPIMCAVSLFPILPLAMLVTPLASIMLLLLCRDDDEFVEEEDVRRQKEIRFLRTGNDRSFFCSITSAFSLKSGWKSTPVRSINSDER